MVLFALALASRHGGKVLETGLTIASVAYGGLLGVFLLGACVETGWRGLEQSEGQWADAASRLAYGKAVKEAGFKIKMNVGTIGAPPSWFLKAHPDDRIITAAGVSAGIDMALRLTELLADRTAAQAAQLMIEYDPQPPFDCGARPKAGDEVLARVWEYDRQRA